jgi:hypothetical protein
MLSKQAYHYNTISFYFYLILEIPFFILVLEISKSQLVQEDFLD